MEMINIGQLIKNYKLYFIWINNNYPEVFSSFFYNFNAIWMMKPHVI